MCVGKKLCLCRDIPDDHWIERLRRSQQENDRVLHIPTSRVVPFVRPQDGR